MEEIETAERGEELVKAKQENNGSGPLRLEVIPRFLACEWRCWCPGLSLGVGADPC